MSTTIADAVGRELRALDGGRPLPPVVTGEFRPPTPAERRAAVAGAERPTGGTPGQ